MKNIFLTFTICCITAINAFAQSCPTILGMPDMSICSGANVGIEILTDIPSTVTWFASDNVNIEGESNTQQTTVTIDDTLGNTSTTTQNISYTITATAISGGCVGNSVIVDVTVLPIPSFSISNVLDTICSGNTTNIVFSSDTPGTTFQWNVNTTNITGATNGTGTSITQKLITTGLNGKASYTVQPSTNSCAGPSISTTVNVLGSKNITTNSNTICLGETTTLTASGGTTYIWSPGGNPSSTIQVSPTASTTYTVSDNTSGCSSSATAHVTVNPLPSVSINYPAKICIGNTGSLTATGASTYLWSTGDTTASIAASPSSTTSYTVTGTSQGCSNIATNAIIVYSSPTVTVTSSTTCSGETGTLFASGASTYNWLPGGGTGASISANPTISTTYSVAGTDTSGCTSVASGTITILPEPCTPTPPLTLSVSSMDASSNSICDGSAFATVTGGLPPYNITYGGNTIIDSVLTIPNLCEGFYTVDAVDANANASSFTFVISAPTTTFVNPTPTLIDSTVVDTLINNAFSDCDINYDLINAITISDFSLIAFDTVNLIWTVSHGTDSTQITQKYHFDFPGVHTAILQLFCTNRATGIAKGVEKIYISGATDIASYTEMNVSIFPNPFNNQVTVMVDKPAILTINNIQGISLFSTTVKEGNTSIDTQGIPAGIYFISIENSEGVITEKLIKN